MVRPVGLKARIVPPSPKRLCYVCAKLSDIAWLKRGFIDAAAREGSRFLDSSHGRDADCRLTSEGGPVFSSRTTQPGPGCLGGLSRGEARAALWREPGGIGGDRR